MLGFPRTLRPLLLWGLLLLPFVSSPARAIESICPGGASPRADIVKCIDFETACADGTTDLCWTDNGFTSRDEYSPSDLNILTDATRAVVGSRYAKTTGAFGASGSGYTSVTLSPTQNELRFREYIRYEKFPHYYFNHGFGVTLDCGSGATRGGTVEFGGQSGIYVYSTYNTIGTCDKAQDLHPNQGVVPQLKNGHYYLIEIAIKMDTSCSNSAVWNGCNGEYKIWIDGTLVLSYTNLNWGGFTHGAKIATINPVRNYYHKRNPKWGPELWYDQIVISNDADLSIGAASGETNLGTAISTPYAIECGVEPFYVVSSTSYAPKLDYAPASGSSISICGTPTSTWRSTAGTANSSIYHTGVITDSGTGSDGGVSRPIAEQSFRAQCTGANCGAGILIPRMGGAVSGSEGDGNSNAYRNGAIPQQVIHGYIYLPSTSVPNDKIAYSGFFGYGTTKWSNYVALSENGGNWAVIQRHNDGTPAYVGSASGVAITRDTWHEFELIVWDAEGFSLMIDGTRIYNQVSLANSPSWLFDGTHLAEDSGAVVGVLDYVGTGTVTSYHDDLYMGSISNWSCDGWGSDCPFSATEPSAVVAPPGRGGLSPWLF